MRAARIVAILGVVLVVLGWYGWLGADPLATVAGPLALGLALLLALPHE